MCCFRSAAIAVLLSLAVVPPGFADQRKPPRGRPAAAVANPLDRVAYAVDGAESSHGADQAMWRADPAGPQGPMQVSEAAATDVGGGDRFDPDQNREIGRAYLAQLYRRYGDWPDAIAAYNWGIGNLETWVKAGRPADGREFGVAAYLGRVLHDSGLCDDAGSAGPRRKAAGTPSRCEDLAGWGGLAIDGRFPSGLGSPRFYDRLDKAMHLAMEHAHSR
jgi:Transglycosylase SLT domain